MEFFIVTFSMNICTQKSEFCLFSKTSLKLIRNQAAIFFSQWTRPMKNFKTFCELFDPISEVAFSQAFLKENTTTNHFVITKEKLANAAKNLARKISKPREIAFKVSIDFVKKLNISNMYFTFV